MANFLKFKEAHSGSNTQSVSAGTPSSSPDKIGQDNKGIIQKGSAKIKVDINSDESSNQSVADYSEGHNNKNW